MKVKSIKELTYRGFKPTYNPNELVKWIDEIEEGLRNKDEFFMEKADMWRKEADNMKERLKKIREHEYYTLFYATYFHESRLVDHAPEHIRENAVIHPRRKWGVLAKNTPFHFCDGMYTRAGKSYPYIRNSEYTEIYESRKEQIAAIYKFLLEKSVISTDDFEVEEKDNVILLFPKDKKGLFIGKKGANVKFVGDVIGKRIVVK